MKDFLFSAKNKTAKSKYKRTKRKEINQWKKVQENGVGEVYMYFKELNHTNLDKFDA